MYIVLPATLVSHVLVGYSNEYDGWFTLQYGNKEKLRSLIKRYTSETQFTLAAVLPLGGDYDAYEAHEIGERIVDNLSMGVAA